MSPEPEVIYTHAALPLTAGAADAVAVADGRIAAVGKHDDILNLAEQKTRVVSLNGAALLPGFHDAHCHVLGFGLTLASVDLTDTSSISNLMHRLQIRAESFHADAEIWLRGRGYSQNILAERRHPNRNDLDKIAGGKPYVLLIHASGHAVSVSSRVLALAGITRETPAPPGGTIERDRHGEPTGVLLETAVQLAYAVAPEPTLPEKLAALKRASGTMNAMGITSAVDATMGVSAGDSFAEIAVFQEAARSGALTVRCSLMLLLNQLAALDHVPAPSKIITESDFVRLGPAKVFTDGALSTRTAYLRSPFLNSDSLGTAVWQTEELDSMVAKVHGVGWQIAAHAIGDAAIDVCLEAYGKALAKYPRPDARHRIEHAMLLWPDQIGRMGRLGVLPIYQPEFIARIGDVYLPALGAARAERLMPYAETAAAGLPLVFSSDLPVVPGYPLDGIAAAALRHTPAGQTLGVRQRVSVRDGLRAYTEGAAYSVFLEKDRGEIAVGQRADFVVFGSELLKTPPDEWPEKMPVQATILGGEVVYGEV